MPAPTGIMPQGAGMGTTVPIAKPPGANNNPIDRNRSVFNPTDVGYMKSAYQGGAGGGNEPTIEEFVTQILKVPGGTGAPVSALVSALSQHRQNTSAAGKMQNMGRPGQAPGGMPRPPMPMGAGAAVPPSPMGGAAPRPAAGPGAGAGQGASRLQRLAGAMGGAR
jgi:hypothetical protein